MPFKNGMAVKLYVNSSSLSKFKNKTIGKRIYQSNNVKIREGPVIL
jgi:hypothetical protein